MYKRRNQWVSLTIFMADTLQGYDELYNLKHLARRSHEQSSKYIVQLLDFFDHRGPNGLHQCLVLELHGPTVTDVLAEKPRRYLDTKVVLRMSKQLLEAIKFIHMIHGGNVNLCLPFSVFFSTH